MIKVAGCWEIGYVTPITEYDLWSFPLRDFGVDEWIMTPVSGIGMRRADVIEMSDINSVIEANPDFVPVFIDETGETKLSDFIHPENALYIFGRVGYSPLLGHPSAISVRVETVLDQGLLWPHQVVCVVLYDRMKKWQQP